MKTKQCVAIAAIILAAMTGCSSQKEVKNTSGLDLTNMDTTAVAGQDFFQYVCGGWNKKHPLTAEYSRFGSFDLLAENNQKQIRELIEGLASQKAEAGSAAQKIGDLYNLAMDSVTLNKQG